MKKVTALCFVVFFGLSVSAGLVLADIPDYVDFHATWSGQAGAGSWDISKNRYSFDEPVWNADHKTLVVDNQAADLIKHVWLEVDWISMYNLPSQAPAVTISAPGGGEIIPLVPVLNADGLGWTWHWTINPQPESETMVFPDTGYWHLGQTSGEELPYYMGVSSVEIGTYCVPEPCSILMMFGGAAAAGRLRRRK